MLMVSIYNQSLIINGDIISQKIDGSFIQDLNTLLIENFSPFKRQVTIRHIQYFNATQTLI
jgi:hypothetical protein